MNHKNNKAVQTVSTLAGMDSLVNGNKVLIMQLINPDIDTADNTLKTRTFFMEVRNQALRKQELIHF